MKLHFETQKYSKHIKITKINCRILTLKPCYERTGPKEYFKCKKNKEKNEKSTRNPISFEREGLKAPKKYVRSLHVC